MVGKLRKRKCPCGEWFQPANSLQTVHCLEAAISLAEKSNAKKTRQEWLKRRQASKPISYWLARAQKAVNEVRRALDEGNGCYTCGTHETVQWEAGHFRSRGACSSARFDIERNIRTQCHHCNVALSGNLGIFRARLAEEIGEDSVQELERMPKSKRWTRAECEGIEAVYKAKLKALRNTS